MLFAGDVATISKDHEEGVRGAAYEFARPAINHTIGCTSGLAFCRLASQGVVVLGTSKSPIRTSKQSHVWKLVSIEWSHPNCFWAVLAAYPTRAARMRKPAAVDGIGIFSTMQ